MADQFLPVAVAPKRLSQSATSSATTITLSDVNGRDGTALTMANFGAVIGYATIEPGATNMEIVSFTGISSTSLTGLTRGLSFKTPYTTVSALQKAHPAGSKVVFSNPPQLYAKFAGLDNEETITQIWTFNSHPTQNTYSAPTSDPQFAPKKYVDTILTSGTVTNDRLTVAGTGGATIVAGNLIYLNTTDGEWYLCDADTASTVDNTLLGIAQGAGTDGVAITSGVLLEGLDTNQSGLTTGALQYASNTAGGISATVGTTEVTVGIARSATNLYFKPRFNQQITENQQDLLDGITSTAAEVNITDGLTGTTALINEATTFFNATDITGAEAETLSSGATSNADSLHTHLIVPFFEVPFNWGSTTEQGLAQQIAFAPDYSDFYWSRGGGGAAAIVMYRFTRDTTTGMYYYTGTTTGTSVSYSTTVPGIFVTSSFVYAVGRNSATTDMQVRRFARDLTGETTFTISGTANTNVGGMVCGNDSSFFVFDDGTGTTMATYTLSGTTATRGADFTIATPQHQYVRGAYFDGTDILIYDEANGAIRRYNTSGTQQATQTRLMWPVNLTAQDERGFPIGLGPYISGSVYVVAVYTITNETAPLDGLFFRGYAFDKP